MKIGDKFGEGVITDMEPDMDNAAFWIKVHYDYPSPHDNVIRFTTSHRNLLPRDERHQTNSNERFPMTYAEYAEMDRKFKALVKENTKLKIENETLRRMKHV